MEERQKNTTIGGSWRDPRWKEWPSDKRERRESARYLGRVKQPATKQQSGADNGRGFVVFSSPPLSLNESCKERRKKNDKKNTQHTINWPCL